MLSSWRHKTNEGRVVYDRKPHMFGQKDIDRIVQGWTKNEDEEILFMSDIADRVLWWIGFRIPWQLLFGWIANRVFNISEFMRDQSTGFAVGPRSTTTEAAFEAWMTEQADAVSPVAINETVSEQLSRLESYLQSFLVFVQERRAAQ